VEAAPTPIPTTPTPKPVAVQAVSTKSTVQNRIVYWANYYGLNAQHMLDIAKCESGFNPAAVNTTLVEGVHATGLYQHLPTYWPGRVAKYSVTGTSIWDYETQAQVTAAMFADGQSNLWECR